MSNDKKDKPSSSGPAIEYVDQSQPAQPTEIEYVYTPKEQPVPPTVLVASGPETVTVFQAVRIHCCALDKPIFTITQRFEPPLPIPELQDKGAVVHLERAMAFQCPTCEKWLLVDARAPNVVRKVTMEVIG